MPTGSEPSAVDGRGMVLAAVGTLAAGATLLVTPGSGAGPAAFALLSWLGVVAAATWAALVDDAASTWNRVGAGVLAVGLGAVFVATVESAGALVIPGLATAGALSRRRSRPRFVALAAWLLVASYIIIRSAGG